MSYLRETTAWDDGTVDVRWYVTGTDMAWFWSQVAQAAAVATLQYRADHFWDGIFDWEAA